MTPEILNIRKLTIQRVGIYSSDSFSIVSESRNRRPGVSHYGRETLLSGGKLKERCLLFKKVDAYVLRQDEISQTYSSHQIRRVWNSTYVKNQNKQMHTHINIYKEIKKHTHYTFKVKNFF